MCLAASGLLEWNLASSPNLSSVFISWLWVVNSHVLLSKHLILLKARDESRLEDNGVSFFSKVTLFVCFIFYPWVHICLTSSTHTVIMWCMALWEEHFTLKVGGTRQTAHSRVPQFLWNSISVQAKLFIMWFMGTQYTEGERKWSTN